MRQIKGPWSTDISKFIIFCNSNSYNLNVEKALNDLKKKINHTHYNIKNNNVINFISPNGFKHNNLFLKS